MEFGAEINPHDDEITDGDTRQIQAAGTHNADAYAKINLVVGYEVEMNRTAPGTWSICKKNHADGDPWYQINFKDGEREIGPI